jgi:hypothetical protein
MATDIYRMGLLQGINSRGWRISLAKQSSIINASNRSSGGVIR